MPSLRSKSTGRALGTISDDDVATLRANLESDSVEFTEFYLDGPTVDLLESAGASATFISLLRALLTAEDPLEIEVLDAPEDDGAPRAVDAELDPVLDIPGYAIPAAPVVLPNSGGSIPIHTESASEVTVRTLRCLVCGHSEFDRRRVQLHGPVATFFDVEWIGKVADCRVCTSCGYMHWFVQ